MQTFQSSLTSLSLRELRRFNAIEVHLASALLYIHSTFFNDRHALITNHNTLAENFTSYTGAGSNPLICAVFLTVRREEEHYLEASMGSLLEGLTPLERRALFLNIIFVNTDPSQHPSWGQNWVHRLADYVGSYPNISMNQFQHLQELEKVRNFYEKEVYDLIHALEACMITNATYLAMFEDDIIVADGWMAKTSKGLSDIVRIQELKHNNKNIPWVYLRLFFTETALSWTSADFAYRNMGWIFIGASLSLLAALMAVRRSYPLPALIGLVYMVGKYSLMPLGGVVQINAHGCYTQGLVFPRDQQLQHLGLKSSRDNLEINTRSTWAFWFEENMSADLRKELGDMLRDIDVRRLLDGHS
ncbi:hypothetical protein ASPACDRAFT_51674 [Aspergillus aculeatus ATCC 16872]|uniref:Uncharacterized protein n=1 Tax=Aspergillus aculeatus (strain ATCC 16872 / CBS 172.66 / WB 5094) TaxID=690307 RepID=A0A1L9WX07_ASPA1|nr:uncharacterized protein ASPACDRAFT_51674 [Aspergillus aculeatus ATCC 16872]OJK00775.1 hypothetical protein ASPACDRAFT_51674 [Aspergillus aculeatus ATCC 16872]